MTRKQNFFGQLILAADLVVLMASYLAAYRVRLALWQLGYPLLPIGTVRKSAWLVTILLPAWLIALRYFNLYSPVTLKSTSRVLVASFKAQVVATVLMLTTVFILRGFDGVSRPLLGLLVVFSFIGLVVEKLAILLLMKYRWRLRRPTTAWKVLLVGSRADAEKYLDLVLQHPDWNTEIVGIVPASTGGAPERNGHGDLHPTVEH